MFLILTEMRFDLAHWKHRQALASLCHSSKTAWNITIARRERMMVFYDSAKHWKPAWISIKEVKYHQMFYSSCFYPDNSKRYLPILLPIPINLTNWFDFSSFSHRIDQQQYETLSEKLVNKQDELKYCIFLTENCLYLLWAHLDFFMLRAISVNPLQFNKSMNRNYDCKFWTYSI